MKDSLILSQLKSTEIDSNKKIQDITESESAPLKWAQYIVKRKPLNLPETHLFTNLENQEILAEADSICHNRIKVWGWQSTNFGDDIDFISFACEHRLEELHYLAFLINLGDAYAITGHSRYAECFERIIRRWYSQHEKVQNTTSCHPVWNVSGCGMRLMSVIHSYDQIKSADVISQSLHSLILRIIKGTAEWLYAVLELSAQGSAGFDGCAGLALAGIFLPEIKQSTDWFERAIKICEKKITSEFREDGGYIEMSDEYALRALDRAVYIAELAGSTDRKKSTGRSTIKRLEKCAEFFAMTCTPLCTTNTFNDSSYITLSGRLLSWSRLFKRRDFIYPARYQLSPEETEKIKKPSWEPSQNLPHSGRAIMRAGFDEDLPWMAVEYSPPDGHSHFETSNFSLFANGYPMVIDRGRGVTLDDPYHLFLRTSRLHSMVSINDDNIDLEKKHARCIHWHSWEYFDCLILEHDAYQKKSGAFIRRIFLFVKPDYWIISDSVMTRTKTVKATSYLHSFPILVMREDGNIECKEPPGFVIARSHGEKEEFLKERAISNMGGLADRMEWTDWVGFRKRVRPGKGATFMYVLMPYKNTAPEIKVTRLEVSPLKKGKSIDSYTAEGFSISTKSGTDYFFISRGRHSKLFFGNLVTDAETGILRTDKSGVPRKFMCINCSNLSYQNKSILNLKNPKPVIERSIKRTSRR